LKTFRQFRWSNVVRTQRQQISSSQTQSLQTLPRYVQQHPCSKSFPNSVVSYIEASYDRKLLKSVVVCEKGHSFCFFDLRVDWRSNRDSARDCSQVDGAGRCSPWVSCVLDSSLLLPSVALGASRGRRL